MTHEHKAITVILFWFVNVLRVACILCPCLFVWLVHLVHLLVCCLTFCIVHIPPYNHLIIAYHISYITLFPSLAIISYTYDIRYINIQSRINQLHTFYIGMINKQQDMGINQPVQSIHRFICVHSLAIYHHINHWLVMDRSLTSHIYSIQPLALVYVALLRHSYFHTVPRARSCAWCHLLPYSYLHQPITSTLPHHHIISYHIIEWRWQMANGKRQRSLASWTMAHATCIIHQCARCYSMGRIVSPHNR